MKAKPSSTLCTRWWPPFLAPSIFSSSHHVLLLFNSFSPSLSGKEGKKEMKTIGCFLCVCVCALQPRGEITWPESSSRERLATQKNYTQPFEREISEGLALFSHSYFFLISLQSLSGFFWGFFKFVYQCVRLYNWARIKKTKKKQMPWNLQHLFSVKGMRNSEEKVRCGLISYTRRIFTTSSV